MIQFARVRRAVDGVLLLDKPTGITSNAAIQKVKRLFSAAKAGHVGTLDPMASGMLPVCLGEATKFSTDAFSADKSYDAEVLLGVTTTTGDREGEVTGRKSVAINRAQLTEVLSKFTGRLSQTPPMYSALKRDGKPLYAYAREGITVERAPRDITIHSMTLLHFEADSFLISVSCTKGTYIRVLAEDIGSALGCGATLAGLRRTRVGSFELTRAVGLAELERCTDEERLGTLQPVDSLAAGLPVLELDAGAVTRISLGQGTRIVGHGAGHGLMRLYGPERRFLGLGELGPNGLLLPKRLVANPKAGSPGSLPG